MNLSKEHFDMYNEYTLNINKIKRKVNIMHVPCSFHPGSSAGHGSAL